MRRLNIVALAALVLGGASPAAAQKCLGFPSFSAGPIRAGAGTVFGDGQKTYGLELAGGLKNGLFATGEVGRIDPDNFSENATIGAAALGYSIPVQRAEVCPLVGYSRMWIPDIDDGNGTIIKSRMNTYQIGSGLGTSVDLAQSLSVTPFISAAYVHSTVTASTRTNSVTISADESDDYGDIGAGLGFVFNRLFTVHLSADVPVGLDGADPTFTTGVSFNF